MKYIIATAVGGIMVTTSFVAGAICMYAIMSGPYPMRTETNE